jgi:beta-carotene hydroxylase
MQRNYYVLHSKELKRDLQRYLGQECLQKLHQRQALHHFLVLLRQLLLLGISVFFLIQDFHWGIWLLAILVLGFTIFNFTVLLHEVIHRTIFAKNRPLFYKILGYGYAIPSGISASQFTRWHLDHHQGLGSSEEDPKRHYLTPKINKRWYKALYFTPALFPIYFRAAAQETRSYPEPLRKTIQKERFITIALHLSLLASLYFFHSFALALRLYILPVFFVFPIAFTLNRLGQHYHIDPSKPAHWGTRMNPSRFWDFAFLWSNYHLEHHYYPNVPFYNLKKIA